MHMDYNILENLEKYVYDSCAPSKNHLQQENIPIKLDCYSITHRTSKDGVRLQNRLVTVCAIGDTHFRIQREIIHC